jgi:hypothetical protein
LDRDLGGTTASLGIAKLATKETGKAEFIKSQEGGGSNDLILFIEQNNKRIEELCARKWPYIEKEDREQVAKMKLAEVFPRLRLDDGHFWQDYELLLDRHMRERKEEMTSLFRFRCRSLDAPMRTKIPGQTCTLFDFLSDDGI